jgi:sterol desaturase/sphingolipid hydroxylase (fatty acid hydroxylase superfamily)
MSGEYLRFGKTAAAVVFLALFWIWESLHPFFPLVPGRLRHAGCNLVIALLNAIVLGLIFGLLATIISDWADEHALGLLRRVETPDGVRLVLALVLLDGWTYLWHRANHVVPFLWRFHRMHHSDGRMDVTTATRFHPGELLISSLLHLALIPLLGIAAWQLAVYEMILIAITQFHHANISLGRLDGVLRWLIVTPDMHKVHHSNLRAETDSNYASILSIWDRLARTFRRRDDPATIHYGLPEFGAPHWQTVGGMLTTPLAPRANDGENERFSLDIAGRSP